MHKKRAHCLLHALYRSPSKGPSRMHEETMRPMRRIVTYMPFWIEMFGRISVERLVSVDAKFSNARRGFPVFRTMFPRRAMRLAIWGYYIKNLDGRGALFAARKRSGRKAASNGSWRSLSFAPLPLRFAAFSRRSTGRGRARCPTAPRRRGDTPPYLMMGSADVPRRM